MAKVYHFRFNIQKAEVDGKLRSVLYGPGNLYHSEEQSMTWVEAKQHLLALSANEPRPHYGCITLVDSSARRPSGYLAGRTIFWNGESHED